MVETDRRLENRFVGLNAHHQAHLISGEARIRSSMSWLLWQLHRICMGFSRPLITIMGRWVLDASISVQQRSGRVK